MISYKTFYLRSTLCALRPNTMQTRLAKFIADSGVASRRDAEKLIASGRVVVNGTRIDTPVFFVAPGDEVKVDGKTIHAAGMAAGGVPKVFAFNKPINTMTTARDPNGRQTIYDALPEKYRNLKYIGRLDYKTTGLLLMTDDGALARKLTMPASGVKRVYIAKLRPDPPSLHSGATRIKSAKTARALKDFLSPLSADDSIFDSLRRGVTIGGIKYAPMGVELLSRYPLSIKIVLTEGKKNEIRIAFDHIGLPVSKLRRVSYGAIELGDLPPGELRELSGEEVKQLIANNE